MQIKLEHLTKRFGDTVAVNDLSITLESGKLIALLGPSGCGKTTTLNMISGILPVSGGSIFFDDRDVTSLPPEKRGIGLVFQNYALYPHMTVLQNICFPMEIQRIPKKERIRRAEELAEMVHITPYLKRKPAELSGGQQQRVAIARALSKRPDVLLLDEPLSNLDAKLRVEMREEIRRIQREAGITTVFVTHDQEEALSISDLIVVMKEGILQQIGKPQEVYDQPANLFVAKFLGTPPINVFSGKVTDGQVKIGEETVLLADLPDQEVTVGIRPEGFVVDEDGTFSCALKGIEVLGRDISIVASHPAAENASIRAIVGSTRLNQDMAQAVFFSLKTDKVFLFDAKDGSRIETALKRPAGKRS